MGELHIIGEISFAKEFYKDSLFCKWNIHFGTNVLFLVKSYNCELIIISGNNWKLISGKKAGQTQVSSSQFDRISRWCFPLDIHLAATGVQGLIRN